MRCFDMLSSYRVACSERDIDSFNDGWPCSELRGLQGITFTFSKRNGDLEDVYYANGNSADWDGEACVALSHDAQAYGKKRLGLP